MVSPLSRSVQDRLPQHILTEHCNNEGWDGCILFDSNGEVMISLVPNLPLENTETFRKIVGYFLPTSTAREMSIRDGICIWTFPSEDHIGKSKDEANDEVNDDSNIKTEDTKSNYSNGQIETSVEENLKKGNLSKEGSSSSSRVTSCHPTIISRSFDGESILTPKRPSQPELFQTDSDLFTALTISLPPESFVNSPDSTPRGAKDVDNVKGDVEDVKGDVEDVEGDVKDVKHTSGVKDSEDVKIIIEEVKNTDNAIKDASVAPGYRVPDYLPGHVLIVGKPSSIAQPEFQGSAEITTAVSVN